MPLSLIIATGNAHKVEEFDRMFAVAGLKVAAHSAKLVGGMPKVAEDSGTFSGNAMLKARALRRIAGAGGGFSPTTAVWPARALDGAPGVDTAVYAGPEATAAENRAKLLRALRDIPESRRGAPFRRATSRYSALTVKHFEFTGECSGRIAMAESGAGGFGYDPLFIPSGHTGSLRRNHSSPRRRT